MANAERDQNNVPTLIGVSSSDGVTPTLVFVNPATGRMLVDLPGGGSGTVTSVSVVSANGFAGTVATATTTPAITLSTSITGILQGNGVAVSAASTTGSGAVVLATSPTLVTPALGTPTALVGTNITGTAASLTAGSVTTNANLTGAVTSVGNATLLGSFTSASLSGALTDETGSGAAVFGTSPTIASPTFSGTIAGTYTIGGTPTFPAAVTQNASTQTLTNKRITRRLTTVNAPGATPTTNSDNDDIANFTGVATAITSMSTNLSGTPVDGDLLEFRFTDNATPQAITWGAKFGSTTVTLPTTTVSSTMLRVLVEWNATASLWQCVATA